MARKSNKQSDVSLALSLGIDAGAVIAMRCAIIAKGDTAGMTEAQRMVTEKISALAHVQWALLTGAYGSSPASMARGIMAYYARGVRANRVRLSKAGKTR